VDNDEEGDFHDHQAGLSHDSVDNDGNTGMIQKIRWSHQLKSLETVQRRTLFAPLPARLMIEAVSGG
jgi:hypothetical protein